MPISVMFEMMIGAVVFTISLLWNIRSYHTKNWGIHILTTIGIIVGVVLFCIAYIYSKT